MIKQKNYLVVLFLATIGLFTACSDDDDGGAPPVIEPTGSIVVEDQTLMNGMVTVSNVEMSNDGWLVIYKDNAGVLGTEVLGHTHVEAGSHEDVTVELDESALTSGEVLWAALHVDSDEDGEFDWNGITGTDSPVRSGTVPVAESFTLNIDSSGEMNTVSVGDQAVVDGTITVDNVVLAEAGWIVVHANNDGAPGEVVGISEVLTAGNHDDVTITFNDSAEVNVGDMLWIMLHSDTGVAGEYEFDGGDNGLDLPVFDGEGNPVMVSITVTE
ncbi:DUF7282 domain-containing protein [Salinimicrobium xinjiangense]|uniref:DUF7282 domain-containing protein n=1 Tax=Salinimicrobium xinjiangense TaxID=438596 RepID=UPI0003FFDD3E|nr:hypothetical protein [Salinimicrobium xinjiangense]